MTWTRDFELNDVLCLSLITDGILEDSRLIAIVYRDRYLKGVIYVENGGNLKKAEEFSSLDVEAYKAKAVAPDLAADLLKRIASRKKLIVMYNTNFVKQFIAQLPGLNIDTDIPPQLDIGDLYTYLDSGCEPKELGKPVDIAGMCCEVRTAVRSIPRLSFTYLVKTYCGGGDDMPKFKFTRDALFCLFEHVFQTQKQGELCP